MKNQDLGIKNKSGFTLLELAIVLALAGVLLTIGLGIGTAQMDVVKLKATQDKLDKINVALTVYYKTNGYLPCPADGSLPTANPSFAKDQTVTHTGLNNSGTTAVGCTGTLTNTAPPTPDVYIGVVPVRTLSLPDDFLYDAWNNRITYVVSRYCIARLNWQTSLDTYINKYKCSNDGLITGTSATPDLNDGGTIPIQDRTTPWMLGTHPYAAYIVISHGKDGYGAWNKNGTRITAPSGNTNYPMEKINGNLDASSGAPTCTTSCSSTYYDASFNDGTKKDFYFDDIVRWRTALQIDWDANH